MSVIELIYAAFTLILLLLAHLHKKATHKEREKLQRHSRKKKKVTDKTTEWVEGNYGILRVT